MEKEQARGIIPDKISTVGNKGKRKWIYALKPKGGFYNLRTVFSIFYLIVFFGLPFIKLNGVPLFMFNILEAKFIFFGRIFMPQDFFLLGLGMITFLVFIVVFTLVFGRVFCGWACPQTIFLEMVFRKIEFWIEGNANKQKVVDGKPLTTNAIVRKVTKHIVFLLLSFLIANTFLSYIIGLDEVRQIISEPISEHIGGFVGIVFFTLAFYAVYAFVREIVCTVICPYGRLQSVLLTPKSMVVAYDYLRGEPRGKVKREDAAGEKGDCIDCHMCVQVCPTGIDIRNGTQMECVNCTACIDACNMMMEKVDREPYLIRIASEEQIKDRKKPRFTKRIAAYMVLLFALFSILTGLLITRSLFSTTIIRVPGQTLQENKDGTISNLYRIKIMNKHPQKQPYHLEMIDKDAKIEYIGNKLDSLLSTVSAEETFFVKVPREKIKERKHSYKVRVMRGNVVEQIKEFVFIGEY